MRLFVAVELDENARWAIGAEQKRLMSTRAGSSKSLRWVRPEQMHLTLVFVGNVDDAVGASIVDAMSGEVAAEPFTLAFGRLGIFPPRGDPSVLWLGVTDGVREAVALQRAVADRLEPAGVARETRPYHPHLTLARWRTARAADRRIVDADLGSEIARVRVTAVTLYRSQLSSSVPVYTMLVRTPLRS